MKALSKDARILPILSYTSGTADRSSSVIDCSGYDAFCVLVSLANVAAGGTNSIKLKHADAASDSTTLTSAGDVEGTNQTIADTDDNTVKYIDVVRPTKRFYQLYVDKDTSNAMAESAVVILYRCKSSRPSTHAEGTGTSGGSAVSAGETHVSPITGTA